MNTGDKFDKAFVPGQKVPIIWAMADTADSSAKHNMAEGEGIMVLEGGAEKAAMPSTAALTVGESREYCSSGRRRSLGTFTNHFLKALLLAYSRIQPGLSRATWTR